METKQTIFNFEIIKQTDKGRVCKITTPHGVFYTPNFFFCATHGSIRTADFQTLLNEGTTNILANTYSLFPYRDLIESAGGIHKFIGWNRPMLTDSGGYQIFSMGHGSVSQEVKGVRNRNSFVQSINEEGCLFKCPIRGDKIFLSPEVSIDTQKKIGADFMVAFDECTPFNISYEKTEESMFRSHRWEKRSLETFKEIYKNSVVTQQLYGVVQGGVYDNLRKISCDFVNSEDFWGVCVGGSLGPDKKTMYNVVEKTMGMINSHERPVHLLGIGDTDDIRTLVRFGIDTFDCVSPTRLARHGVGLVSYGSSNFRINLRNSIHKNSKEPIDITCLCFTCLNHSRSYIHYLFRRNEPLGGILVTLHNMRYMNNLMAKIRQEIMMG